MTPPPPSPSHPCTDEGNCRHVRTRAQNANLSKLPERLRLSAFNEVGSISANITVSFQGDLGVEDKAAFREIHNTQIHIETSLRCCQARVCVGKYV